VQVQSAGREGEGREREGDDDTALFGRRLVELAPTLGTDIASHDRAAFWRLEFRAFAALLIVLRRVLVRRIGRGELLLALLCLRPWTRLEHE